MTHATHLIALLCALLCAGAGSMAQTPDSAPHRSFGIACDQCHSTDEWSKIKSIGDFDHAQTAFALTGRHRSVSCAQCHHGQGFEALRSDCASCHADMHRAEFGAACERCHSPEGWRQPASFVALHETTRFPLLGAHRLLDCKACHANQQRNEYIAMPVDCATCHRGEYNTAKNPAHPALGFPLDCAQCHDSDRPEWRPARYAHAHMALTGGHARLACNDCHKGSYSGTSVDCFSCHAADYGATVSPNHSTSHYPTSCANCHNVNAWKPAQINHDLTGFPLTGGHNIADCKRCHTNGQYSGLSKECISCHAADFNATVNPPHANTFPTNCTQCHTTASWKPATFDHAATHFPLTGKHATTPCGSCHINNQWKGLSTACYSCHAADYARVTNPNHVSANFPRDCSTCHSTSAWIPSTFAHDPRFPIYSGQHRNRWTTCADCHTNPSNYQVFSCIDCHTHSKTSTDKEHSNVKNYSYTSSECYRCHPTGRGG
jgi:hypothetical protein